MGRRPEPLGQSVEVCWGVMHVPSAVPFLWKAVSAQSFILTGKAEALNMTCKLSNSLWFKQDLGNPGLMQKLQISLVS